MLKNVKIISLSFLTSRPLLLCFPIYTIIPEPQREYCVCPKCDIFSTKLALLKENANVSGPGICRIKLDEISSIWLKKLLCGPEKTVKNKWDVQSVGRKVNNHIYQDVAFLVWCKGQERHSKHTICHVFKKMSTRVRKNSEVFGPYPKLAHY